MKLSKWFRCPHCDMVNMVTELLHAKNPFRPDEDLTACPECHDVIVSPPLVCDDSECFELATCGTPSEDKDPGKYRYTCHKHVPRSL